MQPVWDRSFEPPAITGLESQDVLETLLLLYRDTGNRKYLEPVPRAIAYLRKSLLPDGTLARFYELKTNRPLYFTKDYQLTYNREDVPTHYRFVDDSRLDKIETEYKRLLTIRPEELRTSAPPVDRKQLTEAARQVIRSQDSNGAWPTSGAVRDSNGRKVTPPEGVVQSQTFIDNVTALCRFLAPSAATR
jgi:hypothetical protein